MVTFQAWLHAQSDRGDAVGFLSRQISPVLQHTQKLALLLRFYDQHDPSLRSSVKTAHREWRRTVRDAEKRASRRLTCERVQ